MVFWKLPHKSSIIIEIFVITEYQEIIFFTMFLRQDHFNIISSLGL